jgi:hypothetical protein
MKKSKRGQFYLIAAVIICFIMVSFAVISNYVYVKSTPEKFYDIGDILKREGTKVVEYSQATNSNLDENIQKYLSLYKDYLDSNLNADFDLVIFYGSISPGAGTITARSFSRESLGDISLDLGTGYTTLVQGATTVRIGSEEVSINPNLDSKTVQVSLTSRSAGRTFNVQAPVLSDNNFIFVMTTSDEFNNYVQTNFQQ